VTEFSRSAAVALHTPIGTTSTTARANMETILEFFSLYLGDKERFYSLWDTGSAEIVTPFVTTDIATCQMAVHTGWDAVRAFWDPIFDQMTGTFRWFVDEMIPAEDPDVIIVRSHSKVDVIAGETWGNKAVSYDGRYVQIFRFANGKVRSFEEYYDTKVLGAAYGG
jgi:ketosteroid isomerase-like protein